jgi:hypothetical protein
MDKKTELDAALNVQMRAFTAINETLRVLANTESNTFPEYPLMIPTLYLAAICQFVNSYINTFPDNMKQNIISMAYQTIGFMPEDENNLATMPVAGHA